MVEMLCCNDLQWLLDPDDSSEWQPSLSFAIGVKLHNGKSVQATSHACHAALMRRADGKIFASV